MPLKRGASSSGSLRSESEASDDSSSYVKVERGDAVEAHGAEAADVHVVMGEEGGEAAAAGAEDGGSAAQAAQAAQAAREEGAQPGEGEAAAAADAEEAKARAAEAKARGNEHFKRREYREVRWGRGGVRVSLRRRGPKKEKRSGAARGTRRLPPGVAEGGFGAVARSALRGYLFERHAGLPTGRRCRRWERESLLCR